ncbi:MAG: carbohydrate kinase family protein [Sneathiellaceae bacterium]
MTIRSLCIGSAMADIIVLVADRDVERMTMHNATSSFLLLEQGRKIESESISQHVGGGAVNAAVAMARLGLEAAVLVKIGRDQNGDRIIDRLAVEGVDDRFVLRAQELPTGTAVMVSSHDRNATIFTQRGTNTLLRPAEIRPEMFAGRDLVYITNLSNRSADCFPLLAAEGRKAGAFVAVNPGIRQLTSRASAFMDSLQHVDLLAINRVEAEALVPAVSALGEGDPVPERWGGAAPRLLRMGLSFGGFDMGLADFMARLRRRGVTRALVTDGVEGAYLADAAGLHFCPALRAEVVGTAGAGDAFIATLAACLAQGRPAAGALHAATVNAAAVVSKLDTQGGLLDAAALEEGLQRHARDLPVARFDLPVAGG